MLESKKDLKEYYSRMYIMAFDKERTFFHENDFPVILAFLKENYFCDSLMYRVKLLANLLNCDSSVCPRDKKKDLINKSKKLTEFLNQHPG